MQQQHETVYTIEARVSLLLEMDPSILDSQEAKVAAYNSFLPAIRAAMSLCHPDLEEGVMPRSFKELLELAEEAEKRVRANANIFNVPLVTDV